MTQRAPIHVYIDNTSVISGLRGRPGESSQYAFFEFRGLAKARGSVYARWCPGNMGIEGNEVSGAYTKKGCSKEPLELLPTLAVIRRKAKAMSHHEFSNWWANRATYTTF
ncbi:hypothetical protein FDECE_11140 [Fusarium decemcellulare]|nr:hypothetical protein FDECE_11140 [Fusarium decemcellulare]